MKYRILNSYAGEQGLRFYEHHSGISHRGLFLFSAHPMILAGGFMITGLMVSWQDLWRMQPSGSRKSSDNPEFFLIFVQLREKKKYPFRLFSASGG
jgi:hypothetical protein